MKEENRVRAEDRAAHDWYRFVLSFPPHLVRNYAEKFSATRVLDPFCGTGTTLVECKKLGIDSVGIEANPMARFASEVKLDWSPDPDDLLEHAHRLSSIVRKRLEDDGIGDEGDLPLFQTQRKSPPVLRTLPPEKLKLLLKDSISPLPLHKVLVLIEALKSANDGRFDEHKKLALSRALVSEISNLHFGPEVGVGVLKNDVGVTDAWLRSIRIMADDLRWLQSVAGAKATVLFGDARVPQALLPPKTIDAVITSPPYPNEKEYTRTTRLESVLLGFIQNKQELRSLKKTLIRSNTRGVYKTDNDDQLVASHREIQEIAEAIEQRRLELGKTSGFERLYPRVTRLYFGGMARHLSELRPILRPGAHLAYVVGDQASYLRVKIRTGKILAEIAQSLGYELLDIELFRTRMATATKEQLREEVVVLRWPGMKAIG